MPVVDFETAEHSAVRALFSGATLHGCLFHFGQNFDRHAKSLTNYIDQCRMLLKALKGVAFLPEQDVQDRWNELKAELLSYFGAIADTLKTTT